MRTLLFIFLFALAAMGLSAQTIQDCRLFPGYLNKAGFDYKRAYLSTTERTKMGLNYIQAPKSEGDSARFWSHPSWKKAGWLGPMIITEKGEIWVAPVPLVNLLHNKPEEQNFLWKADAQSGELKIAIRLPHPDTIYAHQNPFGLLGLAYDCDNHTLYASSVSGSNMQKELGVVFAINLNTGKIIDQLDSLDVMGIGVGYIGGEKRLLMGATRTGRVWSVKLGADGRFETDRRLEFAIDDLGPRGDDKARKIRFNNDGTWLINGTPFYYNLTAPSEKQESKYTFRHFPEMGWRLMRVE